MSLCIISKKTSDSDMVLLNDGLIKDQNIGKHGYIGNWILRKYRKYR